ncbi:hypothetical protein EVAR_80078_1 [Eumeta japonica]|uniref:Uncharacterized protein n=1 Tax=Eumeta variegata TaxID=151549 RepID=A0A4C1UCP8_EUMVA|nr:hypothetical protein EVAR_80078_1 [Eumeta japonica]
MNTSKEVPKSIAETPTEQQLKCLIRRGGCGMARRALVGKRRLAPASGGSNVRDQRSLCIARNASKKL